MVVIPIQPISVTTSGGYLGVINGVIPDSYDFLTGAVTLPSGATETVYWNDSGIARDAPESLNIWVPDGVVNSVFSLLSENVQEYINRFR